MRDIYRKRKVSKVDDLLVSAKRVVINALETGMSLEGAAGLAGVSRGTFNEWRVIDPRFDDEVSHAQSKFEDNLVKIVKKGADKDPKLAFEMLKARFPAKWGSGLLRENEERRMQEQYDRFQDHSLQANVNQLMNELDFRDRMQRELLSIAGDEEE